MQPINESSPLLSSDNNEKSFWNNRVVSCLIGVITKIRKRCPKEFIRRYSDVASQVALLGLNILFLVGMVDHKWPPSVANISYFTLNFIGLIPLPFQIDWTRKLMQDSLFAKKSGSLIMMFASSLKATYLVNGILLTFASCGAAITRIAKKNNATKMIYKATRPWNEAVLVLGFILNIGYIFIDRFTLKKFKNGITDKEVTEVIKYLKNSTPEKGSKAGELALYIRGGMDKDTLRYLIKKIHKIQPEDLKSKKELIKTTGKNIGTQLKVRIGGNLVLKILGDILIGIEDMYPGTVVDGSINLGVSLIYTAKLLIEKKLEIGQRMNIKTSSSLETVWLNVNNIQLVIYSYVFKRLG